jgi:hypothetical protein
VALNQSLKLVARQRREFPRLVGEVFVDTNLGEGDNPVFVGRPASGSPTACCRQSPIRRVNVLETCVTPPMSSRNFPRACNPRITGISTPLSLHHLGNAIFRHLNYKLFKEQLNRRHRFGRLGAGYLAGGHRTDNGR